MRFCSVTIGNAKVSGDNLELRRSQRVAISTAGTEAKYRDVNCDGCY